ncbi:right-handed parallel beta-helix repeat-containing protein [Sorangium sp. So ce1182]|uniref:right-handed parallel beta-helix repeat-containing protein n=1 Tax=Sorangium sp. So ce1182 TaxID=3133334 RepID=UPI003F600CAE
MIKAWNQAVLVLGAALIGPAALGCASDPEPQPSGCPGALAASGACIGVPAGALCGGDFCAASVDCAEVVEVSGDAALSRASGAARPGACIALGPGAYGPVALPPGVSLLGRGAGSVTVAAVSLAAGDAAVLRGLTVGAGGVQIAPGARARIEAVRVAGSASDGVTLGPGASLDLVDSAIEGSARHGLSALDARRLSMTRSIVSGSQGPGLWAQCTGGCDCEAPVDVQVEDAILRDNKVIGVSLVGARATLSGVEVSGNAARGFDPSGGVSVSGCSILDATALRVADNSGFGLLIDQASASLGGDGEGFEVSGNQPGIWIQHTTAEQPVTLRGGVLEKNRAIGLGMSGDARGIIIDGMRIAGTFAESAVVSTGSDPSQEVVGDGVSWQERAQAAISGLVLSGNGLESSNPSIDPSRRASVLIDGGVGPDSRLADVTLEGGDEATGIVQQRLSADGASPLHGADVPRITTSPDALFSVPVAPAAPAALDAP